MELETRDFVAIYGALVSTVLALAKIRWPIVVLAPHRTPQGVSDDSIEFRFHNPSRRPLQVSAVRFVPRALTVGVHRLGDDLKHMDGLNEWITNRGTGRIDLPVFIPGGGSEAVRVSGIKPDTCGLLIFWWHRHSWLPPLPIVRRVHPRLLTANTGAVSRSGGIAP